MSRIYLILLDIGADLCIMRKMEEEEETKTDV